MKISLSQIAIGIKEYVIMTLGMFMYAFGWVACVIPAGGMGGGATGLSMLLNAVFPSITMGTFVFAINVVLLIVAGFIVGWNFGIKTIYCIIVLSIAMDSWGYILPPNILVEYTQNIDSHNILLVILGAVIAGSGVAVCFSQGGSTGGTDIVAMIINKYKTISYGKIVISSDFFIIGCSLFVASDLATGIATVIYGYIMIAVYGYTVDLIQSGSQQSSQIFIISPKYQQIADIINNDAHRGVTIIDGTGWYTKKESKIVMVVCRKRDASMILKLVRTIDADAFITMGSVMGVYGKGFEALSKI
ncbi:MAG: YitT family protein [Alistipes sp.]|nr:YitT family protein [Alistipes sp.]MBQ3197331.1 YitT family protein [Alistipes sp.]MBQ3212324.1 YitT family protein [Alistipes sp.]MBQ4532775.1 YitT family protein [Alistipes sp.]MBQ6989132.1 YitT family protein [Alistipes sp.]